MDMSFFPVERVFFEKYIHELSSDAFKVLIKMIYLAKSSENDINIRSNRSLRRIIGVNTAYADSIWNELITKEFVIKRERRDKIIYVLNSKKIKNDNIEFTNNANELRNLSVTIFNVEAVKPEGMTGLTEEIIQKKVKQIFDSVSSELLDEIIRTVKLLQRYHIDRDKKFRLSDLGKFLVGLVKYKNDVVKDVCFRYNNNVKIAGMRGLKYVLRMAQGIDIDRKSSKGETLKSDENIAEKRKVEGEMKFAIKLAKGDTENSLIFKRLLRHKDYDKLIELWKYGVKILKDEGREAEIYNNYDWLKLQV